MRGYDVVMKVGGIIAKLWFYGNARLLAGGSRTIEYFFSGWGVDKGPYLIDQLPMELSERILRGELFTLGRHYLSASLNVELTPLTQVTPTVVWNTEDQSGLTQFALGTSLSQNILFTANLNIPFGAQGSEFGGPGNSLNALLLSTDISAQAQVAWYF